MFRRKDQAQNNDEPRWLTDYRNKYALDYESRVASALHASLGVGEDIAAEGRACVMDPKVKSEAYVCITNQRFLCTLLNVSKPLQSTTSYEFPLEFVTDVVPDDDGRSTLVEVITEGSEETNAFVLYTGAKGTELRNAMLVAADVGRALAARSMRAPGRLSGMLSSEIGPPDWGPGVAASDGNAVIFTTKARVRHTFESWNRFSGVTAANGVTLWLAEPLMGTLELQVDNGLAERWIDAAKTHGVPERADPRFDKMLGGE
jgi:hypothetical protein